MEFNVDWKAILWQQFGAAIDMLENAIQACPDHVWTNSSKQPAGSSMSGVGFWYVAFHTIFWLDFYLSESKEGFAPPAPFSLSEFERGKLPERSYTKDELQAYLDHARKKCRAAIGILTGEKANQRQSLRWGEVTRMELLLYNMRHVQHHAAQLNLMLRQTVNAAPKWVPKTKLALREQ